jgi:hypothetical protein
MRSGRVPSSPDGPFTKFGKRFTFLVEQFWGRAARASNDSKESDAPFIFSVISDQEKAGPEGFEEHPPPHLWSVVGGYGGGPQFPARFQGKGQSKAPWGPRVVKRTPQIERGELNSNIIFTYADFISTASLIVLRFRNKCLTDTVVCHLLRDTRREIQSLRCYRANHVVRLELTYFSLLASFSFVSPEASP